MAEKQREELGDDVPGLPRAVDHIMIHMGIALEDVLTGVHDKGWFLETMRQDIRYFVWLYSSAAAGEFSGRAEAETEGGKDA